MPPTDTSDLTPAYKGGWREYWAYELAQRAAGIRAVLDDLVKNLPPEG